MLLYHGSKHKIERLEKRQAQSPDVPVPSGELKHAVYLTPSYEAAISMAARVYGNTEIKDGKITFEHPELFDPERPIYVYSIESDKIPDHFLEKIDDWQYVFTGPELEPDSIQELKAAEVLRYFEITNWPPKEKEKRTDFKIH